MMNNRFKYKTRFQQEISGDLGEFWVNSAKKELRKINEELREGKITIDENGVARNCIGRAVMNDLLEKIAYLTDDVNIEATQAVRDFESRKAIAEYRANYRGPSEEELAEMRAAFGPGEVIVDVITGSEIRL